VDVTEFLTRIASEHLDVTTNGADSGGYEGDELAALGASILSVTSRLAERFEEERQLTTLSEEITRGVYRDEVLDYVFESFRGIIPYDRIGCALLEDGDDVVRSQWARSDYSGTRLKVGFAAKIDRSSLQTILDTGEPRIINDTVAYLEDHPHSAATKLIVAEGIRSSLTCPLVAMGRPIGFLFFSSKQTACYKTLHQKTFMRVAAMVSIAVEKSVLYEELAALNRELTQARTLLEYQASHDSLTGVLRRGSILAELTSACERHSSDVGPDRTWLGVVMCDIDHFKKVNDTYGHPVGDAVLQSVTSTLAGKLRGSDAIGRYGGEEFLIVATTKHDSSELERLVEQLRATLEHNVILTDSGPLSVTASFGIAIAAPDEPAVADLMIERADRALYAAKNAGRNQVIVD